MQHLIKEIKLLDENYSFLNDNNSTENRLRCLSKINIFVGENNSGKSRLLRSLISSELNYIYDSSFVENYNKVVKNLTGEFASYYQKLGIGIESIETVFKNLNKMNRTEYLNNSINTEIIQKLLNDLEDLKKQKHSTINNIPSSKIGTDLLEIVLKDTSLLGEQGALGDHLERYFQLPELERIYIPILRGMKPLKNTEKGFEYEDFYGIRTRKDYFNKSDEISNTIEIFTGTLYYDEIKYSLLGTLDKRKMIAQYEKYLSENFFDKKPITLIPSQLNGILTIKIGDEKERPIYELGDGIESIIILTMPLFINKGKNLLVFIEEPEKLLHPGLQRKLIETLLYEEGFENYQYFITTHSNHLLDITLDSTGISIYSLRKELDDGNHDEKDPKFLIENLSQGDVSALELLGVRNSSVFLSNCTIWVEGITDRLYFRHYLKLYFKHLINKGEDFVEFKEDFHYSFVEYGGGNITHWSFLDKEKHPINVERLCRKLFLITDRDRNKEKRHNELKEKLGDRFYCLECKEVENLISKKVLREVIKDYEKAEPLIENFEESDYKKVYLGKFINDKLGINKQRKGSYAAKSGTVSDKVGFCQRARNYTTKWDDLSNEAKEISERIYQFIKENNQ